MEKDEHRNEERETHRTEGDHASGFCGANFSARAVIDAVQEISEQVEVSVLALMPPPVTEHLMNSQKELLKAGQRMTEVVSERSRNWAEKVQASLDRKAARAKEMHDRMKAEREAKKPATEGFKAEGI